MDVVSNVELNATERIGLMEMRIQQKAHRTPSHSAQLYGTEHSPINRYIQKLLSVPSFLERCQGCRNHDTKPGNEHVWPELRVRAESGGRDLSILAARHSHEVLTARKYGSSRRISTRNPDTWDPAICESQLLNSSLKSFKQESIFLKTDVSLFSFLNSSGVGAGYSLGCGRRITR